jgi:3,5-epimerase/4-reductase
VLDVKNSLTYLPDFLRAAEMLIRKRATGTYNMVNPGAMSPYEIMERYRKIVDPTHAFERLTLEDLSGVVKAARSNCVLSCEKLHREGMEMLPVEEAVTKALQVWKTGK